MRMDGSVHKHAALLLGGASTAGMRRPQQARGQALWPEEAALANVLLPHWFCSLYFPFDLRARVPGWRRSTLYLLQSQALEGPLFPVVLGFIRGNARKFRV